MPEYDFAIGMFWRVLDFGGVLFEVGANLYIERPSVGRNFHAAAHSGDGEPDNCQKAWTGCYSFPVKNAFWSLNSYFFESN